MSTTRITAGDASTGLAYAAGDDGALVLQTGAAGSKVNALSFSADGTPTFLKARGGLAQVQTFQTGAVATGTTIIPSDDTIPQNTEGDQYMSLAFTPTNAASTLEIEVVTHTSVSVAGTQTYALFQDSTASALAASSSYQRGGELTNNKFTHVMSAGSTSATTFKVRAGLSTAATTTFNGIFGARSLGGVMPSRITIKEYLP